MKRKTPAILIVFFFWFSLPEILSGQEKSEFPRDTSFSQKSAFQKIRNDFPNALIVEEFEELLFFSKRDLIYTSCTNRSLHLDIFYPKEREGQSVPAVLCIHGGGWASGDKSHLVPMAQQLASEGLVAVSIEYRLSPEATFPAAIIDIKAAIRWMKENAKEYDVDTSKIAILGTSAGGSIASFIGTTIGNTDYLPKGKGVVSSDEVHAIINIDGIVDFTDPAESGKDGNPAKPSAAARWFGYTYIKNPELWIEASPLIHVDKNTPPTLFINSSIPRFHAGRDKFIEVLKKNAIYSDVQTVENTPHPFWLFYPWFDETLETILEFITVVFALDST